MPDWVTNRLYIWGRPADVALFCAAAAGGVAPVLRRPRDRAGAPVLSFERLRPTPPALFRTVGDGSHDRPAWADWRLEHWGTLRDAVRPHMVRASGRRVAYEFSTEWLPPVPLIQEISRRHPDLWFALHAVETDEPIRRYYFRAGRHHRRRNGRLLPYPLPWIPCCPL